MKIIVLIISNIHERDSLLRSSLASYARTPI
jgi:hypothetical protein